MKICDFKIVEVKKIVQLFDDLFKIDLSDFTYVNLKIKLQQFCKEVKINSFDTFLKKIRENENFRKNLLETISFDSYELFRDPAVWRVIKENIILESKQKTNYRVFFPSCHQGSELVSFLILRDELALTKEIEVIYTSSLDLLNKVKEGFVNDKRKQDLNLSNYKRIAGKDLTKEYFVKEQNKLNPITQLFENTNYYNFDEKKTAFLKSVNLIIYRNKLINYNQSTKKTVINNLLKSLKTNGYLVIGIKEVINSNLENNNLICFDKKENIYIKKL